MANTIFSVQYLILSQAPIKESQTQFSGSTGIYLFRDYLVCQCEPASSHCSAGNPVMTNRCVSELGNTPMTRSQRGSEAPNKQLSLLAWCFPSRPAAVCTSCVRLANEPT